MSRVMVRPNALDRAVAAVAPRYALQRLQARYALTALTGGFGGGYTGGRRDRRAMQAWRVSRGDADADILPQIEELRERSRDLERNTPIAAGAIDRVVTHSVGLGLRPLPQIDREALRLEEEAADQWERQAERELRLALDSPDFDASGHHDFAGSQELLARAALQSGDAFAVRVPAAPTPARPYGFAWQVYEADQVSNPNFARDGQETADGNRLIGGVELDRMGRAVAYHIQARHPGDVSRQVKREWHRIEAIGPASGERQVLHVYDRRRPGQTRGVPYLAPVIEALKQLGTYSEAELFAAVIGAMVTVVHKAPAGQALAPVQPESESGAGAADADYKMVPGTVLDLMSDDDLEVPNVGRPNANFDPFFVAIVRQIGAALHVPFEVLIMHFTASYSASRAALEMAWQFFRRMRAWLITVYCRPVYEAAIAEAVARGRLAAPGFFADALARQAWLGCAWVGSGRISLDPMRENNADKIAQDEGWRTAQQITAEKFGGNWERNHAQRAKEVRLRREGGLSAPPAGAAPGGPGQQPAAPPRQPEDRPEDRPENEEEEDT